MANSFSLDRMLVDAIQVSATSRDQLAAAVVAGRDPAGSDRNRLFHAFQQHSLLTIALALAYRPDDVSPMEALAAANEVTLDLIRDETVPDVAAALPGRVRELWPRAPAS